LNRPELLPGAGNVRIDIVTDPAFSEQLVSLEVLRLDRIHPVVSGNKLFKLNKFMEAAVSENEEGLLTFGGAFSNHLVATAFLCRLYGKKSIGIVRGEALGEPSPTLRQCRNYGMELEFVSRDRYAHVDATVFEQYRKAHPHMRIVPEGGYEVMGMAGAAQIAAFIPEYVTHIACATGTCTMMAGLYKGRKPHQHLVALPAIKGATDILSRLEYLLGHAPDSRYVHVENSFHFGGYAKHDDTLIRFMNEFHFRHGIPTDKVYTAKLLFGVRDMIARNCFPQGSRILAIHSGGLQGNASLRPGTLSF
jgi:D-cysteine desulfhydrase